MSQNSKLLLFEFLLQIPNTTNIVGTIKISFFIIVNNIFI